MGTKEAPALQAAASFENGLAVAWTFVHLDLSPVVFVNVLLATDVSLRKQSASKIQPETSQLKKSKTLESDLRPSKVLKKVPKRTKDRRENRAREAQRQVCGRPGSMAGGAPWILSRKPLW